MAGGIACRVSSHGRAVSPAGLVRGCYNGGGKVLGDRSYRVWGTALRNGRSLLGRVTITAGACPDSYGHVRVSATLTVPTLYTGPTLPPRGRSSPRARSFVIPDTAPLKLGN